jgi:release factor glutamine methyltransferase
MTTTFGNSTEPLGRLRARLRERLAASKMNPRDADVLLCDALDRSPAFLISHADDPVDESTAASATRMVARRLSSEPLQYVRGHTEFFGRRFAVDPRVLIPRPETEILVEAAIKRLPPGARVLDVGTGSGCIAISIERERPDVAMFGTDRSIGALAVARYNRSRLSSQASFLAADFLAPLRGAFDFIVSNPPYIPAGTLTDLAPEVRDHEPHRALSPGPRGTEAFEVLLREGAGLVRPRGQMLLEIGFDQAAAVRGLASEQGWVLEEKIADLAGILRVVVLSRR